MANFAQTVPKTMVNDTVISNADTLDSFASTGNPIVKDSLKGKNDTVKKTIHQDSFLKDKVTYDAKDSILIDMEKQKAYLFNHAHVTYQDIKLDAGYIEIDFGKDMVFAASIKDSAGKDSQLPVFLEGKDKFTAEKITYNFKTKKGKINEVITQQGDGYIHGRDIKKDTNNVYYVAHGKFTTCDLEHPHFYIGAKKIKVIPNDKIVTGPACLYIADIPTPLCVPFGFFPNKIGRQSGILIPSYGESANLGFFLKDGGFYFGNSEKVDLQLRGDIYSNGSYGFKAISNYAERYQYHGGLNFSYSEIITGDKELPNSTSQQVFFIRWNHAQDPKSNPDSRFTADVNAGSSQYNKYNGAVTGAYLQNTFSSNIAYQKTFIGTPFNFSANLRHSQNTQTKQITASLPELALTMNRIYPFKSETSAIPHWWDKIGISASANARNDISAYDSTLFTKRTLQQMNNGMHIAVPISTSFNVLKVFTLTPSINMGSSVYFQTLHQHYDPNVTPLFIDTVKGAKMANDFNLSASLATHLYGDYFFKSKHLKQIRHVATPTISMSYRPDFSESQYGYYHWADGDVNHLYPQYSIFQNGIYGSPGAGRSALVAFTLSNTLEAKTKQQSDSGVVFKKVSLIDNLGVSLAYNAAARTNNWSNIILNGRTKLFKKLDINMGATLDPYVINSKGGDSTALENTEGKFARLTAATISIGTSLHSDKAKYTETKTAPVPGAGAPKPVVPAAKQDELDYINAHRDAYVDFNIPWNLSAYYNLNYTKLLTQQVTQSVTFNGDLSVTKKWKVSVTSGYDFVSNKLTLTSINVYRDLHCWEMKFNWVPFGFRQSYSVDILVKAASLRDLKLSRRKDWYDY